MMPSFHRIRSSSGGDAAEIIDVDAEDERGVLPFVSFRSVSPAAPPDAVKSEPRHDGGVGAASPFRDGNDGSEPGVVVADSHKSSLPSPATTTAPVAAATTAHRSESHQNGIGFCDGKDMLLGLDDEKYGKIIKARFWPMLWGEKGLEDQAEPDRWQKIYSEMKDKNSVEEPKTKDIAPKILDELIADVESLGGIFYRREGRNGPLYKANNEQAEFKIHNDLQRGKYDYPGSRFSKNKRRASGKDPGPLNNNGDGNYNTPQRKSMNATKPAASNPVASGPRTSGTPATVSTPSANQGAPTKLPALPCPEIDLAVSLRYPRYKKIVKRHARNLLYGCHDSSFTTLVSTEVKTVRDAGGEIFKLVKPGMYLVRVDDEAAHNKMKNDIKDMLSDAQRNHEKIVIVHMGNEKYKNAIVDGARGFVKECNHSPAGSRARETGEKIMQQFRDAGVEHFLSALENKKIECSQALDKIVKDVQDQARLFRNKNNMASSAAGDHLNGGFLSSTRRKPKRKGNNIDPCLIMANYVISILPNHGWTLKRRVMKTLCGLELRVVSRTISGKEEEYAGDDEILDYAYLSGFYEKQVVGTDEGKEYLELAGILGDPFKIFSSELRERRRKRRKIDENQTNSLQSKHQMPKPHDNADESHDKPSSQTEVTGGGLEALSSIMDVPGVNLDAEKGSEAVEEISEVRLNQNNDVALRATGVVGGAETRDTGISTPHRRATAGAIIGWKKQVRKLFEEIKLKLSSVSGVEAEAEILQRKFYSHLKRWLACRMKNVVESDLTTAKSLMEEFESGIESLKKAKDDKDEESVTFYTNYCEDAIEECKTIFPV